MKLKKSMLRYLFFFGIALFYFVACNHAGETEAVQILERGNRPNAPSAHLPILGERVVERDEAGNPVDTIYHTIPAFEFIDQDSQQITEATVAGKLYVVDFFFTSCPTICPIMKKNMMAFYEAFKDDDRVLMLSHSIDTRYDTPEVLRRYANNIEVDTDRWKFLTGDRDHIYDMATLYLIAATEDPKAPGGYTHSGNIMLIDTNRYIRGYYDGTKAEHVTWLIADTRRLLNEEFGS